MDAVDQMKDKWIGSVMRIPMSEWKDGDVLVVKLETQRINDSRVRQALEEVLIKLREHVGKKIFLLAIDEDNEVYSVRFP